MAVLFARILEDGERVVAGAHTEVFFAATLLAQKMHAPNLRLQLGGTCLLVNVRGKEIGALPVTSTDYRILGWAESHHDHPNTFIQYRPPGGRAYYEDGSPFRDRTRFRHFFAGDKFFVGGIQADRWGNVNLIGLGGAAAMTMRGPGTIGICDSATSFLEIFVFVTGHDRKRLVEKVDFVSMLGNRGLREHGFPTRVRWIVTPLAIFDFDPRTDQARLFALLPGASVEQIRDRTGFHFDEAPEVHQVVPPTERELLVLRREVDPTGVLRAA
jgi:glutaconate CoA-transferase subunit B